MNSGKMDRQITVERKAGVGDPEYIAPDTTYGTERVAWVPIDGYEPGSPQVGVRFWAEVQDALPSRAESVTMGLAVARNQVRIRFRYRDDVRSDMHVLLHGDGDDEVLQIVGGPAAVGGRKVLTEIVCERSS